MTKRYVIVDLFCDAGMNTAPLLSSSIVKRGDDAGSLATTGEAARAYQRASKSPSTVRAYASAWRSYLAWCGDARAAALPASPATVANYLAWLADRGYAHSTIGVAKAAIAAAHAAAGEANPTASRDVELVTAGIAREIGTAGRGKAPTLRDDLARMAAVVDRSTPAGVRDLALLLAGWAGAFRRSELVALNIEDVELGPESMAISVRRSKTDQTGRGLVKHLPNAGGILSPVAAMRAWLAVLAKTEMPDRGPLWRRVERDGELATRPGRMRLTDQHVARLVKRLASAAGLDPARYAGHSLRSGLITAGAEAGVPIDAMAQQAGHKRLDTTLRYQKRVGRAVNSAVATILEG